MIVKLPNAKVVTFEYEQTILRERDHAFYRCFAPLSLGSNDTVNYLPQKSCTPLSWHIYRSNWCQKKHQVSRNNDLIA